MRHGQRLLIGAMMAAALAVALALLAPWGRDSLAAGIIYVDAEATGANDGTSWADAFTTLQPALDAAGAGDQIWVAAGTYKPSLEFWPGDPQSASFQMKNGVALYGGFDPSAGAVAFEDRDWVSHVSILSGDLNGDDEPDFTRNGENSYHVFYHPEGLNLDGSAILDGFTVTGGNTNGDDVHNQGGGMYNHSSSPTLANCTFAANWAEVGAGMYNNSASPTMTNCTFSGNIARTEAGGIYNDSSSPTMIDCTFAGNSAVEGGGMYNWASSPTLINVTFSRN